MGTNRTPLQNILRQFIVGGTLSDDRRMLEPRICLIISISFYWTKFFFADMSSTSIEFVHDGVDFACGHRPNLLGQISSINFNSFCSTIFIKYWSVLLRDRENERHNCFHVKSTDVHSSMCANILQWKIDFPIQMTIGNKSGTKSWNVIWMHSSAEICL